MQGLKFAGIDLTRIISSLGLLEMNHPFSKLHLEFTRQHHGALLVAPSGGGFGQGFPTLGTAKIPNMQ